MVGFMESSISPAFHTNQKKARSAAVEEAAVSNGLLCTILSVKAERDYVWLIGNVSRPQLQARLKDAINVDVRLCSIRVSNHGSLHTTWQQIVSPAAHIGYVSIHSPIYLIEQGAASDSNAATEDRTINVAIRSNQNRRVSFATETWPSPLYRLR